MGDRNTWIGRGLGVTGMLLGIVVGFRYLITDNPSDIFLGLGLGSIVMIATWVYLDWDLISGVAGRRGTKRQAGSWLMVLLGLGIVILVNYLSFKHNWEKDITEGGVHTLNTQTLDLLDELEQEVSILGFYQQVDGTGMAMRHRENFEKMTDKYVGRSDLLSVEVVDPDLEPRLAIERGVFQNGVVFLTCGDREERVILPDENELTNALVKVTRSGQKTVYFLAGHGEPDIRGMEPDSLSELAAKLTQTGFEVEELELYREGMVPADANALIIASPKAPLLDNEVPLIRDYVERRGGAVLVFAEPETVTGLEELLLGWGVELGQDFVVDLEGQAMVGDATTVFAEFGFHEITEELAVPAILYNARSVTKVEGNPGALRLLRSSSSAWSERDLESVEVTFDAEVDELGPVSLGVIAEVDRVESAPVVLPKGDDDSAEALPTLPDLDVEPDEDAPDKGAVVVIGDVDLATNGYLGLFGNADLVLNCISYITHEEDLITIRAPEEEDRPILLTKLQRGLVLVISVPGITMLVLLIGVVMWFIRLAR